MIRRISLFFFLALAVLTCPLAAEPYRTHTQTVSVTTSNTTVTFTDNGSGGDGAPVPAKSVIVYNAGPATVFVDCKDNTATSADTAVLAGLTAELVHFESLGGNGYLSCGFITGSGSATATVFASAPRAVVLESRGQSSPLYWSCSLDSIGATLTECQAAPAAGVKLYLTDVVAQSTTATAGQMLLRYGTGANCGTGTASLFPAAATVVRIAYPANTSPPTVVRFSSPLSAPAANAVCVLGVITNTVTVQLSGYMAP